MKTNDRTLGIAMWQYAKMGMFMAAAMMPIMAGLVALVDHMSRRKRMAEMKK